MTLSTNFRLIEIISSLGENTSGRSQADVVEELWTQSLGMMGNKDLGQVDVVFSFARFGEGEQAWTYYEDGVMGDS